MPEAPGDAAAQEGPRELFDFRGQRTGVAYGSSGSAAASVQFLSWRKLRQVWHLLSGVNLSVSVG